MRKNALIYASNAAGRNQNDTSSKGDIEMLKSRYVRIRELETDMETDKMPKTNFLWGIEDWHRRQAKRQKRIIELNFFIRYDYERMKESGRIRG